MISYKYIFIYSGGKTGSSTLFKSIQFYIQKYRLKTTLYYGHVFESPNYIYNHSSHPFQKLFVQPLKNIQHLLPKNINEPILVLSSYREPIQRHISSFFHNLSKYVSLDFHSPIQQQFDSVSAIFLRRVQKKRYWETYHPFSLEYFSFDIHSKYGWQTKPFYHYPYAHICTLRFQDISQWQSILQPIFPNIRILNDNLSSMKDYAILYRYFSKHFEIPPQMKHDLYHFDSSFLQLFFIF